jgi:excisionase family DNA binding protein
MRAVDEEYVTVAQAATLLQVAPSTIRRWIRAGNIAAYRVGWRRVALKRIDLPKLITPVRVDAVGEHSADERTPEHPISRQLTPEEQQRGLAALAHAEALSQEIIARRGGKFFSPGWEILDQLRDERGRQLT